MTEANPGRKYTAIMKTATTINPITAAFKLVEIASTPNCAPTTLECSSSSSSFSPPIRMVEARLYASS